MSLKTSLAKIGLGVVAASVTLTMVSSALASASTTDGSLNLVNPTTAAVLTGSQPLNTPFRFFSLTPSVICTNTSASSAGAHVYVYIAPDTSLTTGGGTDQIKSIGAFDPANGPFNGNALNVWPLVASGGFAIGGASGGGYTTDGVGTAIANVPTSGFNIADLQTFLEGNAVPGLTNGFYYVGVACANNANALTDNWHEEVQLSGLSATSGTAGTITFPTRQPTPELRTVVALPVAGAVVGTGVLMVTRRRRRRASVAA